MDFLYKIFIRISCIISGHKYVANQYFPCGCVVDRCLCGKKYEFVYKCDDRTEKEVEEENKSRQKHLKIVESSNGTNKETD